MARPRLRAGEDGDVRAFPSTHNTKELNKRSGERFANDTSMPCVRPELLPWCLLSVGLGPTRWPAFLGAVLNRPIPDIGQCQRFALH
ncbi:hypothetical protein INR49_007730 [Caranx melampygus]|nr:hypothetical protein INR49_007730 [Caranx melampygus]